MQREQSRAYGRRMAEWSPIALASIVAAVVLLQFTAAAPQRAWQIYLLNVMFAAGVVAGAVAWSGIFHTSKARWPGAPLRFSAEFALYLPAALALLMVALFAGRGFYPATHPHAALWLRGPFLYARELVASALLATAALFVYARTRQQPGSYATLSGSLLLIAYAVASTFAAWDFVVALDAEWYSALFGGYYMVGNLYAGIALITALTASLPAQGPAEAQVRTLSNLGKLLLTFSLLWVYLFWSQYLVIWYGNLPREIGFVQLRTAQQPWSTMAWMVLLLLFAIPFAALLTYAAKRSRSALVIVCVSVLLGTWLERFVWIAPFDPSCSSGLLAWQELAISGSFGAIFILTLLRIRRRHSQPSPTYNLLNS